MDRLFQVLLSVTLLLASTAPAAAQSAGLKTELLKDWLDLKETMHRLAEAMPEDKYAFKTTPPQRDFGQQVAHIAGGNVTQPRVPWREDVAADGEPQSHVEGAGDQGYGRLIRLRRGRDR